MSPILGIYASARPPAVGDYESIATVTVGSGGTANVEFTSIPATYTHLQIRYSGQISLVDSVCYMRFNGDTGNNYRWHQLTGSGATASAYAVPSATSRIEGFYNYNISGTFSSSTPNATVVDILDYTSTNKNKTVRMLNGVDYNGGGRVELVSGVWFATPAAITSISLNASQGNYVENSKIALYGIK